MKKILFLLTLALFITVSVQAQRGNGWVQATVVDTLNGNEAVNFAAIETASFWEVITFQALCTEVGGTSDGDLIFQGSVDGTSYADLIPVTGEIIFLPNNDTLTITDGAIMQVIVYRSPFNFYRFRGQGTASDSTLITMKYVYKK